MDKKLGRLLHTGTGLYYFILLAFSVMAIIMESYILAIIELGITVLMFIAYMLYKKSRRKQLQAFIQKSVDQLYQWTSAETPFPMVVTRLSDNGIVYANDSFSRLTGYEDTMLEKRIEEYLPDFSAQWLLSGKTECPKDVTIQDRRYRIYGIAMKANDPQETKLGIFYLTDLTELYQVRDEYIRSRPVVSIILVDN